MRKSVATVLLLALSTLIIGASGTPKRHVERMLFAEGLCIVVAESDLEPRSIGSFSVNLYRYRDERLPTDDFVAGIVLPRDGTIERTTIADVNADGVDDLIVIVRSAGSGGFQSGVALRVMEKSKEPLRVLATVGGLAADADPVSALTDRVAERGD